MEGKRELIIDYVKFYFKNFKDAQGSYLKNWGKYFKGEVSHPGLPDGVSAIERPPHIPDTSSEHHYLNFWKHITQESRFVMIGQMMVSKKITGFQKPDSDPSHLLNIPARLTFVQKDTGKTWKLRVEYKDETGHHTGHVNQSGKVLKWSVKNSSSKL